MNGRPKELRLGIVCYGGSSLAIYMHGVTKEIHRLVKASALRGAGTRGATPSESVYLDLLEALVADSKLPDFRVIVDVIAGTSAGGINGIYLAKALAGNRSLDSLRSLWFERGDMTQLVDKGSWWRPWERTLPGILGRALKRSVLRGNDMSVWLHDALKDMDDGDPSPSTIDSLLPPDHPLDLHVTITDFYGYRRDIALSSPGFVADNRHRHVVTFHYDGQNGDDFADNAGLTFAARTTSCFPAVFPPVSLAELADSIGGDLDNLRTRSFRIYELNENNDPDATYFVDGGVLDNKPFGWAIDTIVGRRPADAEVDRRLIYIEPDPSQPKARDPQALPPERESPTTLRAAIGSLTTIPRREPILDDLLELQMHNEKVDRIRDVIETNFQNVAACVSDTVDLQGVAGFEPGTWPWTQWNEAMDAAAMAQAGMTYSTYMRLRLRSVVDGFADSICAICNYPPESNHALLVRESIRAWARGKGLIRALDDAAAAAPCAAENDSSAVHPEPYRPTDDQVAFLNAFDLGFRRRRLRFVIAAFNWWYRCVGVESFPPRQNLDDGKAILYGGVAQLDALALLRVDEDEELPSVVAEAKSLRELVRRTFDTERVSKFLRDEGGIDGEEYARSGDTPQNLRKLFEETQSFFGRQLAPIEPEVLRRLTVLTANWDTRRWNDLVVRYLGFPVWDVLLYPVQALTQTGERDAVEVVRVSPAESRLLPTADGMPVLGVKRFHFYAFFDRAARENDYLRGRLDAAEQMVNLLFESADAVGSRREWAKRAFEAIMKEEEEADALPTIKAKVAAIKQQIAAL